ncbi:unnamed protein product, partial [Effrenium voratum]
FFAPLQYPSLMRLRRWIAQLCSRLPRAYGLAGFVLCCVLPCRCLERKSPRPASFGSRQVLLLGLDNSGKSAFLWLAEHPTADTLPAQRLTATSGTQRLTRKEVPLAEGVVDLEFCEVGGAAALRPFWHHYLKKELRCIAFFVNLDDERLEESC